jgi:NADPH:quinone reductase-like Zn-dependent oxidoreductase
MKAIIREMYGRPSVLKLRDVDRPAPTDDEVLIRVHASSVNPVEWYDVTGFLPVRLGSGLRRPKDPRVGADVAGRVESVGRNVRNLTPGQDVFGTSGSAWAEYACARPDHLAVKPASVSFEDAAATPIAAITALQALRDHGRVQPGQKVLINGASGGVGTFAVQLAKAFGAEVTGVCSPRNVEQTRLLGADRVVDYTREDFTTLDERFDLMLDIAGSRPFLTYRRVLTPTATVVMIGAKMTYRGLGPLPFIGRTLVTSRFRSQAVRFFVARTNTDDLTALATMLEAGTVRSVIDRTFPLSQAAEALAYLGEGHARGKVVITV